jgi:hypothetical protein
MRRTLPITAAALAALLAVPAAAPAKGIDRVLACGPEGCTNVTDRVPEGPDGGGIFGTGSPARAPSARHRFVVVRVGMRDPSDHIVDGWTFAFVPALDMVRYQRVLGVYRWGRLTPQDAALMDRLVRGVEPWPAQHMRVGQEQEPTSPAKARAPVREASGAGDDGGPGMVLSAVGVAGVAAAFAAAGAGLRRRRRAP